MNNIIVYNPLKLDGTVYGIFFNIFGDYTHDSVITKLYSGTSVLIIRQELLLTTNPWVSTSYYEVSIASKASRKPF